WAKSPILCRALFLCWEEPNDSTAGPVVLGGTRVGDLNEHPGGIVFDSSHTGVSGLKPNAHYVAVFYSPYLGFGNLRPFARYCFRTEAAWNPNSLGAGCGAETSLAYVQQCYQCKYVQTDRRWDANTNRCVSASS
ncbi:MAG: hypothetical protein OXD36_13365, partial [Rhodobacter sp.]|nr:hypothetical protein [Rhodobacter sp.]